MTVDRKRKLVPSLIVLGSFSPLLLSAQGENSQGNLYLISLLIIVGALILVSAILMLSENLISIESAKNGVKTPTASIKKLWGDVPPKYTEGYHLVELNKGHDILLNGAPADNTIKDADKVTRYAVRPTDFRILAPIPKVTVEVGDEVKAGDVIFHDKKLAHIKFVAPVSGEVVEVRRGEKRAIAEIIILADKEIKHKKFEAPSIAEASREEIVNFLCDAGAWPLINERPFDVTPSVDTIPKNIFISTFDSAPLAPDQGIIVEGREVDFQKGLDTLARLTSGKVYLGLSANGDDEPHSAFVNATGVEKTYFKGKHPAGNVGIQIHHTAPIHPGDQVWTLSVQDVITIGTLMYKGIFDASRIVAITGAQVAHPAYVRTYLGANIGELVSGNLKEGKSRIIAGDVLTGKTSTADDFMPFNGDQITVISEGDYYEMFGWLLPIAPRPTISKTFPNFLFPNLKFDGDTNSHGEHRAFVVSGQYEEVLPMSLYPQHLMKAIMIGDFEQMEGLGIHELSEEDIALCEFACTSKMQLQEILRDGLDLVREQG